MTQVEIVDDAFRRNVCTLVTSENKDDLATLLGRPFPVGTFLPHRDDQRRQVQAVVKHIFVFEGAHLDHAIKRARRFIRSRRLGNAPAHIARMLAAYHKHDPEAFKADVQGAMT